MAKRFSGDVGDFKPKKPKKLNDYKESSRFSFKLPGGNLLPNNECGDINVSTPNRGGGIGDGDPFGGAGRSDGAVVNYSPDQLQNYTKSYPRFERALGLMTDSADYSSQTADFLFCSESSSTGFWSVQIVSSAPDYYVDAGRKLTIICPAPYRITTVATNSLKLIWTQLEGGRLAIVDTEEDSLQPELIILDDVRSLAPIRFEIVAEEDEDARDILTIYTTPTSTWESGIGFNSLIGASDASPSREIPAFYAPLPPVRQTVGGSLSSGYTWKIPTADTTFITGYTIQQNIGGVYQDVASYLPNDFLSYEFQVNQHYRVLVKRNTLGFNSTSDGFRIYFQSIPPVISAKDIQQVFSGFSGAKTVSTTLPLDRKVLYPTSSHSSGVSFSGLRSSSATLPLDRKLVDIIDTYANGVAFSGIKTVVTKVDLGGVIIS